MPRRKRVRKRGRQRRWGRRRQRARQWAWEGSWRGRGRGRGERRDGRRERGVVEDVAGRHAEVVRVWSGEVLEVTANLVDEPKAELRIGGATADGELVTPVNQADPVGLLEALAERAARDDHAVGLAEFGKRRRVAHRVRRALPAVAARVVQPEPVNVPRAGGVTSMRRL